VAAELEAFLLDQGMHEGSAIPSTADLATRFNVSRTVIREALAQLSGRGMLRMSQGKEGVVAMPGSDHLLRVFQSRVAFEHVSLLQLHDFREILEVGAARLAARHRTPTDVARLSDLLNEMRVADDDDAMLAADVDFHRAIAHSANPLLGTVVDGLTPLLLESRRAVWASYVGGGGHRSAALMRHVELRDHIAAGDEESAATAMVADLADTREHLGSVAP
jgi:GntR family transcriptional repressor for pyruvate dehydrogenase complex